MYLKKFTLSESKSILTPEVLEDIETFDKENILPYCYDPFLAVGSLVMDEEKVVAVGVSKFVNEFKVIINPSSNRLRIAEAIKGLIDVATEDMEQHGSDEVIAVITQGGEKYQEFLTKHFKFRKVEGSLMRLEV